MDDAAGFVGLDVVAVEGPFEGCAAVHDVAVGVGLVSWIGFAGGKWLE